MPKVSVILTSFNHEKYIREAIGSVLNQTFSDFELIIWDDASSDNSWAIINSYSDPRIRAFRNDCNKRAVYGINEAISELTDGEYIAIHHSDDEWKLDKLEKQVDYLDSCLDVGAVFTNVQIIDEHGFSKENEWFSQNNKTQWEWLNQLFVEENHLNHPSILIRKQCYLDVGLYKYGLAQTTDAEMWSRVLLKYPIHVIQEKLTRHRLFSDKSNTSGSRPEVLIRLSNEWNVVKENFLTVTSFEDCVAIFPNLQRFQHHRGHNIKFLMSMACLYESVHENAWQLGLKWLFELLNDQDLSKKIKELYEFSYFDFIKLQGELDVYGIQSIKNFKIAHSELSEKTHLLENVLSEQNTQITTPKKSIFEKNNQPITGILSLFSQIISTLPHIFLRNFKQKLSSIQHKIAHSKLSATPDSISIENNLAKQQSDIEISVPDFDATFYKRVYPDTSGLDPYFHYINYGKMEGRFPCPQEVELDEGWKYLDQSKKNVLIVSHEASRTGAPILALNIARHFKEKNYNVIAFLIRGGDVLADFQDQCSYVLGPYPLIYSNGILFTVLEKLLISVKIDFAIVNSMLSASFLPVLSKNFIPSVFLIHEFATYLDSQNTISDAVLWADKTVFSAQLVYENNAIHCENLERSSPTILPQGKCIVPDSDTSKESDNLENERILDFFRPDSLPHNTVIILGAGSVQLRKGVDLFLACAARVVSLTPNIPFRFVWIGKGFEPELDMVYSAYIQDQINRSGLENLVCFPGEISNIDLAYELSDILLLSSRLDPLPNVAIDAMFQKLPVLCFDKTTGIADILKENGFGKNCVMPYLDIEATAHSLVDLIDNSERRNELGNSIQQLAFKLFDMKGYVDSLENLALDSVIDQENERKECSIIETKRALDLNFYLSPKRSPQSYEEAVRCFVRSWHSCNQMRKPFPGFHPGIYETYNNLSDSGINPLVAYINAGKPKGPWLCEELIKPPFLSQPPIIQSLSVALHIYVEHADLFPEILQRLEIQNPKIDLLISVPTLQLSEEVRLLVKNYKKGKIKIKTVTKPINHLTPLFTEFSKLILNSYEVIGHVAITNIEDKKKPFSANFNSFFSLVNLIGEEYPMASVIIEKLTKNQNIGLIFPEHPEAIGWGKQIEIANEFAKKLEIKVTLETYFNFPLDGMFWARTEALHPLWTQCLKPDIYLEELFNSDEQTLQKLLPFAVKQMGYTLGMINLPNTLR